MHPGKCTCPLTPCVAVSLPYAPKVYPRLPLHLLDWSCCSRWNGRDLRCKSRGSRPGDQPSTVTFVPSTVNLAPSTVNLVPSSVNLVPSTVNLVPCCSDYCPMSHLMLCPLPYPIFSNLYPPWLGKEERKKTTAQAAMRFLHQLRKRRQVAPLCCESPPPWCLGKYMAGSGCQML